MSSPSWNSCHCGWNGKWRFVLLSITWRCFFPNDDVVLVSPRISVGARTGRWISRIAIFMLYRQCWHVNLRKWFQCSAWVAADGVGLNSCVCAGLGIETMGNDACTNIRFFEHGLLVQSLMTWLWLCSCMPCGSPFRAQVVKQNYLFYERMKKFVKWVSCTASFQSPRFCQLRNLFNCKRFDENCKSFRGKLDMSSLHGWNFDTYGSTLSTTYDFFIIIANWKSWFPRSLNNFDIQTLMFFKVGSQISWFRIQFFQQIHWKQFFGLLLPCMVRCAIPMGRVLFHLITAGKNRASTIAKGLKFANPSLSPKKYANGNFSSYIYPVFWRFGPGMEGYRTRFAPDCWPHQCRSSPWKSFCVHAKKTFQKCM